MVETSTIDWSGSRKRTSDEILLSGSFGSDKFSSYAASIPKCGFLEYLVGLNSI